VYAKKQPGPRTTEACTREHEHGARIARPDGGPDLHERAVHEPVRERCRGSVKAVQPMRDASRCRAARG